MDEKRKFIRIDLCAEINYEVLPMSHGVFSAQSRNISEGGMCFLSGNEIKLDSVLRLNFRLPDSNSSSIECLGRVIWQNRIPEGFLTGIEFKGTDLSKQIKIGVFVLNFLKQIEANQEFSLGG